MSALDMPNGYLDVFGAMELDMRASEGSGTLNRITWSENHAL